MLVVTSCVPLGLNETLRTYPFWPPSVRPTCLPVAGSQKSTFPARSPVAIVFPSGENRMVNAVTGWHDPDAGASHREWARAAIDAASDASTGRAYVNFLGDTDAGRSSYGDETYARLVALKNEYDPTNVFRLNQNIEPQAAGS